MTIYVLSGFNNYYNRQIKRMENLTGYETFVSHIQQNYNFVPNDNVNTQVVLGNLGNQYAGDGDYLLVVNEFNQIVSRWFIIESVRDRAGQYTLILHRDLVADHFNELMDAPMYIEKATLNENDPFIFNSENLSLNQIKSGEYQIKDKSDCAWIVGYLSRNDADYGPYNLNISSTLYNDEMTQSEWETLVNNATGYTINDGYQFLFNVGYFYYHLYTYAFYLDTANIAKWNGPISVDEDKSLSVPRSDLQVGRNTIFSGNSSPLLEELNKLSQSINEQIIEIAKMSITSPRTGIKSEFNEYLNLNGKIVKVLQSDGNTYKYYKISTQSKVGITNVDDIRVDMSYINNIRANLTYLSALIARVNAEHSATGSVGMLEGRVKDRALYIDFSYEEVSSITIDGFTIPSTRRQLQDAPYDMFCIPYKEGGLNIRLNHEGDNDFVVNTIDKIETLSFAQKLAENLGKNLLDIQLLPFCPLQGWNIEINGIFNVAESGMTVGIDFTIKDVPNSTKRVVVFYSTKSEGTINHEQLNIINNETGEKVTGALPTTKGAKMSNQCDMYRLCSPNWNGQFEFTPAKCGLNSWYQFNVDYTYLPYSPYIHINPNFSQLYGKDYDDARGLICQGDFSISYMSDAWINYQVQNKNYLNTFNRGTENLELNQKIERNKQIFNAVTGTVIGAAGGATMGAKAGGGAGAIAGAAAGLIAGAVGGTVDVAYGDILREEALDYRQDMFNYSLDNIQALPDSIAKVTAYTKNNRIFPTLEYYTCTDTEKRALAKKIAWNGMTVMRIGTMSEFVGNDWSYEDIESKGYIKGKLIRLETVEDDYHIINALSGELDKGVYIK